MGYTSKLDTAVLDALRRRVKALDGSAVEWGIWSPPSHHSTIPSLARVEFGAPSTPPRPRAPKRRRGLGRRVRATLGKLLRGFRGRKKSRARPKVDKPDTERPVLRWVASARRREMVAMFKLAALRAFDGLDHEPVLDQLGQQLAQAARDRLQQVGGVVTGQTKRSIKHKVTD